jgi:hypothetical protein
VFAGLLWACAIPGWQSADSTQFLVRASSLNLAWDPPPTTATVTSFRIYYRPHGGGSWSFVGETPATGRPTYTVDHGQVGNGAWDFAVQSVSLDYEGSSLHTSLDAGAYPLTGWYVLWLQSPR